MSGVHRDDVVNELERVKTDFRAVLQIATATDLRRKSDGTQWNNLQLLFHMLFGYLIVATLQPLMWAMARPPPDLSSVRQWPAVVNAPFHVVNYLGSLGGGRAGPGRAGMTWLLGVVIGRLQISLRRKTDDQLRRGMHFPVGWDPYFKD